MDAAVRYVETNIGVVHFVYIYVLGYISVVPHTKRPLQPKFLTEPVPVRDDHCVGLEGGALYIFAEMFVSSLMLKKYADKPTRETNLVSFSCF